MKRIWMLAPEDVIQLIETYMTNVSPNTAEKFKLLLKDLIP